MSFHCPQCQAELTIEQQESTYRCPACKLSFRLHPVATMHAEGAPPSKSDECSTEAPPHSQAQTVSGERTGPHVPRDSIIRLGSGSGSSRPLPQVPGYEVLSVLGRGGMGVVYQARQLGLNRVVALKMIRAGEHAGEEEITRFHREAEAVARLQHPHIVQIFEIGQHDGMPYYSMEHIEGDTLHQHINGTALGYHEAARLLIPLCTAMQAAHQAGVVHRDLKPGNVLLQIEQDPENRPLETTTPKITDFGLAKQLDVEQDQTVSGAILGTPAYMAPEQAAGRSHEISSLTDVYALGAILYECLTGKPPFSATSPHELLDQVCYKQPVPCRQLQPGIPQDLQTICLKCLEKNPEKRYASAQIVAEELERFLSGQPILARPVGKLEKGWRWCRRNPMVASLAATVFLLLCATTAGAIYEAFRIRNDRDEKVKIIGQRDEAYSKVVAEQKRTSAALVQAQTEKSRAETALEEEQEARDREQSSIGRFFSRGGSLIAKSDLWGGILRFATALERDGNNPKRAGLHRLRVSSHLNQTPRLLDMWATPRPVKQVRFSPEGRHILIQMESTSESRKKREPDALVWDLVERKQKPVLQSSPIPPTFDLQHRLVRHSIQGMQFVDLTTMEHARGAPLPPRYPRWEWAMGRDFANARLGALTLIASRLFDRAPRHTQDMTYPIGGIMFNMGLTPGGHIVTSDPQGWIVWNGKTGELLTCHFPPRFHSSRAPGFSFGPDLQKVLEIREGAAIGPSASPTLGQYLVHDLWSGATTAIPLLHESTHGQMRLGAFSPDGKKLVTSQGTEAFIWDVETGKPTAPILRHSTPVRYAVFSPKGTYLATGNAQSIRVWLTASGAAVGNLKEPSISSSIILARGGMSPIDRLHLNFSPDEKHLMAITRYTGKGAIRLWKYDGSIAGRPGLKELTLRGNLKIIQSAQFSPDGRWLIAVGRETDPQGEVKVLLWQVTSSISEDLSQVEPVELAIEQDRLGAWVELSPNGKRLVVVSSLDARVWDLETRASLSFRPPVRAQQVLLREKQQVDFTAPGTARKGVFWSPDSRHLLVISHDKQSLWLWDTEMQIPPTIPGQVVDVWHDRHRKEVKALVRKDTTLQVFDAITAKPLTPPWQPKGGIARAEFTSEGNRILTIPGKPTPSKSTRPTGPSQGRAPKVELGKELQVWDASTGKPITDTLLNSATSTDGTFFTPDGRYVLTVHSGNHVQTWLLPNQVPIGDVRRFEAPVKDITFVQPAGRSSAPYALVSLTNGSIHLWKNFYFARTGKTVFPPPMKGLKGKLSYVSGRSSSRAIAWVQTDDFTLQRKHILTGEAISSLITNRGKIKKVLPAPDGRSLIVLTEPSTISILSTRTGKQLGSSLILKEPITEVQFTKSPAGTSPIAPYLLASTEKRLHIVDCATGAALSSAHLEEKVIAAWRSYDYTKRLKTLTVCTKKKLYRWNAATGELLGEPLTHVQKQNGAPIRIVRFSDPYLLIGRDQRLRVWNAHTRKPLAEPFQCKGEILDAWLAIYSPTKWRVAVRTVSGIRLWRMEEGKLTQEDLALEDPILAASAYGSYLCAVGKDAIRIWDLQAKPCQLVQTIKSKGAITQVRFGKGPAPDVTVADDKGGIQRARWTQPSTYIQKWQCDTEPVFWKALSGGNELLTVDRNGKVLIQQRSPGRFNGIPFKVEGKVIDAVLSNDKTELALHFEKARAQVWNVKTGMPLSLLRDGWKIRHMEMAPSAPSYSQIIAQDEQQVQIMSVDRQTVLCTIPFQKPLKDLVLFPSYSRSTFLTTTTDGDLRLWLSETGQPLSPWLSHNAALKHGKALREPGKPLPQISSARWVTWKGTEAIVWDLEKGLPIVPPLKHDKPIDDAFFFARRRVLITRTGQSAQIWSATTGRLLQVIKHPTPIRFARAADQPMGSRDSSSLLLTVSEGQARVDQLSSFGRSRRLSQFNIPGKIQQMELVQTRLGLLLIVTDKALEIWSLPRRALWTSLPRPKDLAEVRAGGGSVLIRKKDGSMYKWLITNRDAATSLIPLVFGYGMTELAINANGSRILTQSNDGSVRLWNTDQQKPFTQLFEHSSTLDGSSFSPNGQRFFLRQGKEMQCWDAHSAKLLSSVQLKAAKAIAFYSEDDQVRYEVTEKEICQWDVSTGRAVVSPLPEALGEPHTYTTKKPYVVFLEKSGALHVWDVEANARIAKMEHQLAKEQKYFYPSVLIDSQGQWLLWEAGNGTQRKARVWSIQDQKVTTPPWSSNDLTLAKFSPDGAILIIAEKQNNTIRLYESRTGEPLTPAFTQPGVVDAWLSFDNRSLFVATDKEATVYHLASDLTNEQLIALAQANSGRRIDEAGAFQALPPEQVQTSMAHYFATRDSRKEVLVQRMSQWHRDAVQQYKTAKDYKNLVHHLSMLIGWEKRHAPILVERAKANASMGKAREAIRDYSEAIALSRPTAALLSLRGRALTNRKEWHRALLDFQQAVQLPDATIVTWGQLARLRLYLNDINGYQHACEAALEAYGNSDNPSVLRQLVWLCTLGPQGIKDPQRIVKLAQKLDELPGERFDHLVLQAAGLYRAGEYQKSLEKLKAAQGGVSSLVMIGRPSKSLLDGLDQQWFLFLVLDKLGQVEENRRTSLVLSRLVRTFSRSDNPARKWERWFERIFRARELRGLVLKYQKQASR